MKKKEIIEKSLKEYKNALKEIKNQKMNFQRTIKLLDNNSLERGVCHLLAAKFSIFNTDTPSTKWITRYYRTNSNGEMTFEPGKYWGKIPYTCSERAEVIDCLKLRRDILQKELKKCK